MANTVFRKKNAFKASHKNTRTYYFIADSEEDKQRWMDKMLLASILYDESDKESGYGTAGTGASPVATELCKSPLSSFFLLDHVKHHYCSSPVYSFPVYSFPVYSFPVYSSIQFIVQ